MLARLTPSAFSLMLSVLPATAAAIGLIVLQQVPTLDETLGIGLVAFGVALRRDPQAARNSAGRPHRR